VRLVVPLRRALCQHCQIRKKNPKPRGLGF
jgi:hypothetical protein